MQPEKLNSAEKPALAGLRFVEIGQAVAAPYCGLYMARLGGEVIKVEPFEGDMSRNFPLHVNEMSSYFASVSNTKQCIGINSQTSEGRKILTQLIQSADAVISNSPNITDLEKIGIPIKDLEVMGSHLIIVNFSAFGLTGPLAGRKGYDLSVAAFIGSMHLTGPNDNTHPYRYPGPLIDIAAAKDGAIALLAALREREMAPNTEGPRIIDINLMESAASTMFNVISGAANSGENPKRQGDGYANIHPYGVYEAAYNRWFAITLASESNWRNFLRAAQLQHLEKDDRFTTNTDRVRNYEELNAILMHHLNGRSVEELGRLFYCENIPGETVLTVQEFLQHPQSISREIVIDLVGPNGERIKVPDLPIAHSGLHTVPATYPDIIGAHTNVILQRLGYSPSDIQQLRETHIVC